MELANIINVLWNMLVERPEKLEELCMDEERDRLLLFKRLMNGFMVEFNK